MEMTVFMGSSIKKRGGGGGGGGNGMKHQKKKKKKVFGEAPFLTTSYILVLVIINVCS